MGGPERVAVSAAGTTVGDEVDPHFGRCERFLLFEEGTATVVENTAREAAEGAGLRAAQLMIDHGITAVLTGSVGPKAYQVLRDAGIRVYPGASGTIEEVLRKHRDGQLAEATGASHGGHGGR